jgi:capsular polysaccharide transport system permease protein
MRRRHWGVAASFLVLVVLPFLLAAGYLFFVASDQYGSKAGFTVRSEESGSASDILGGLSQFAGSGTGADNDVLYEFIQSQEMVEAVDARLNLRSHYAQNRDSDPLFSLPPDASVEDMVEHWLRVVRISYDRGPGLIDLQVLAFDPETAQLIAFAILDESSARVNALNTQAREDAMGYANADLETAVARLKSAREALTAFRVRTQIVDPQADIQGRMGVLNTLQQQLAEALIDYDLLLDTTSNQNDPRLTQAAKRIEVIRERIAEERATLATEGGAAAQEDYPSLIAEFESLTVDREVAEENYRAALTALDVARANAQRQSRYLATYVRPTRATESEYPQRWMLTGLTALFLVLAWGVLVLIYYSIRDRS